MELQTFNFENQQVRILEIESEPYFVGKDVAEALGYELARKAILDHVDSEDKQLLSKNETFQNGTLENVPNRGIIIINESGLYSLILSSKLPKAKEFKRWVTSDILPSIRKTGSYSVQQENHAIDKQAEANLLNAKTMQAKLLLEIGNKVTIPEYQYICQRKAAEIIAGEPLLPMQEVNQKTYSATEIADMLGVTPQKIGRLSNANNLKTKEYGKWFYDKSQHSSKEVETFRYFDSAIPVFKELLA